MVLFFEYGKNREDFLKFVDFFLGEEMLVILSFEVIDFFVECFRKSEENIFVYLDIMKSLIFKEVYEFRKYFDFDVCGGFFGEDVLVLVFFVEGKMDFKFFKVVMKKFFDFREFRIVLRNLKFIEKVFECDNFDFFYKDGKYVVVILSEGNFGVIRNLGNFFKVMDVFGFGVERIGVVIDVDEDREVVMVLIIGKLVFFSLRKVGDFYLVWNMFIVLFIIGFFFEDEFIDWKKLMVEDLMFYFISVEGFFEKFWFVFGVFEESFGRKFKLKEVMYLVFFVYGYWGNFEGFYEFFVMCFCYRYIKDVFRKVGFMEGLCFFVFVEC